MYKTSFVGSQIKLKIKFAELLVLCTIMRLASLQQIIDTKEYLHSKNKEQKLQSMHFLKL